jgi:hypothetical protein
MASTSRRRVEALAVQLGAIIDNRDIEVNIEAPHGYVWATGENLHELINSPFDDETQADMYVEALRRMQSGLEPCPLGTRCEWCYPLDLRR